MSKTRNGILVVGHGSRREEANSDVRKAARLIGERSGTELVEAAFLEIEKPTILEGFMRLISRGARSITVHPYFLSPGRHTRGDLPVEVAEAAAHYPGVEYRITEPLSAHDLVIAASIERIRETERKGEGTVSLVGAGPGDPGLLTVRASERIRNADTVIYDSLVHPKVLELAPARAERIFVGKTGHGHHTPQERINRLIVLHARLGNKVVRLKGGDPFIYGRGGEEALALSEAGIKFEVVPGISSAVAVPAYAGIPLTHRGVSASVKIVTASRAASYKNLLPESDKTDTLVILMGACRLRTIAQELITSGRASETPIAVISWGTYEDQLTVSGTLQTIADNAEAVNLQAPAVIVVGEVVRLREQLKWFGSDSAPDRSNHQILDLTAVAA